MKTTDTFKNTIKAYLDKRAAEDSLFAQSYAKEGKNIDDCCTYITSRAKKEATNGCAVISDDEVFGWAVHYYDEDDIKVGSKVNYKVATSKPAKKKEDKKVKITKSKKRIDTSVQQLSLF